MIKMLYTRNLCECFSYLVSVHNSLHFSEYVLTSFGDLLFLSLCLQSIVGLTLKESVLGSSRYLGL
jgi:hypothetical protein